jgi:hypothetical protein
MESLFDAKQAEGTTTKPKIMNNLHQALVTAGLLGAIPTDEAAGMTDFTTRWNSVSARLANMAATESALVTAKAELSEKETALVTAKATAKRFAKANADTVVAKYVDAGVIAPKDETVKAKWSAMIEADPDSVCLLESMKPAAPNVEGKIITAKSSEVSGADSGDIMVLAKQVETEQKVSFPKAMEIVANKNPKLYSEYLKKTRAGE